MRIDQAITFEKEATSNTITNNHTQNLYIGIGDI